MTGDGDVHDALLRVSIELAFPQRSAFNSQSVNACDPSTTHSGNGYLNYAAPAALLVVGFSAVVGQIVLMRELIVAFNGNEISLGVMLVAWLLWTAAGSSVAGLLRRRIHNVRLITALLECLLAASLPPTIWALRDSKAHFQSVPGELVGLLPMLISTLVCLSVFCTVSGALFVVAAKLFKHDSRATASSAAGSAYLLEAAGSAIGGVLASIVLLRLLDSYQITTLIALLNVCMAVMFLLKSRRWRTAVIAMVVLVAVPVIIIVAPRLDKNARVRQWRGFDLIATRDTIYGNLAVTATGAIRSIYSDGVILANAPDPAAAEEAVHYALLEHPAPKSVLLIGGGINGAINEVLKHPSVEQVDYVELDPALIAMANQFFPAQIAAAADQHTHSRTQVHTYLADGRRYLQTTRHKYDAIVVNVADPQTAQLNRFYTVEFFRTAREHLMPGGVFAIQMRSAEETLSPDLKAFLRCIRRTLAEQFPYVVAIPGGTIHFAAATSPNVLTADPRVLLARMSQRHLQTQYVNQYFIPYRMAADRMRQVEDDLQPLEPTPINHDFTPVAYYFNSVLWSAQFDSREAAWLRSAGSVPFIRMLTVVVVALMIAAVFLAVAPQQSKRPHWAAAGCTAATGFTLMALQILLLLGFESVYGYVYHQLAILVGLLMAGIALGSWLALRHCTNEIRSSRHMAVMQVLIAFAGPALLLALQLIANISGNAATWIAAQLAFPALATLAGMLGGYQFVIAAHVFMPEAHERLGLGALYAIDLLGGCAGAFLLSTYLIPVFGFRETALLLAVINLAALLPVLRTNIASGRHPA